LKEEPQPQARRPRIPKEEPQPQVRRPLILGSSILDLGCLLAGAAFFSTLIWWWWRPDEIFLVLLGFIALRLLRAPMAIPAWRPRRVLAVGILAYSAIFSFVTLTRHLGLRTHALDLGYYVQLTWNLARGAGPYVSLPEMNAWGDHLSPIMYLLAPLFWVAPGAGTLLVIQSVALALGALAVFGIAARRLGDERPAAVFAILYLVNPSLHGINVRDFHAAALAIPLLLAAFYFAERDNPWLFALAVLLALGTREDATIPVVGLGIWLAVAKRRWLWGAVTAAAAFALLVADTRWLMPHFRGAPYPHLGRYAHLGRSVPEIAWAMLLHPFRAMGALWSWPRRLFYLGNLFGPLAFLPLLAPAALLALLPPLLENLLGQDPVLFSHRTQYQSFVLPFLMNGAIAGYERLARKHPGRWPGRVLTAAMIASLAFTSPTVNDLALERSWPTAEHRQAWEIMAQVPAGASLSAQDQYVAHLSLRPLVFVFPVSLEKAEYALVNAQIYPWRALPDVRMRQEDPEVVTITGVASAPELRFRVKYRAGPHLLLEKR
jgi:uncharacterized membrane protein